MHLLASVKAWGQNRIEVLEMKVFFFCERRAKGAVPDLLLLVRPVVSTKYIKYFNQPRKLNLLLRCEYTGNNIEFIILCHRYTTYKTVVLLQLVTFGYMFWPLLGHHQANKE